MKTLKYLYENMILTCRDLKTVKLFESDGEVKIEKDLFGYRVVSGKKFIQCKTEEEARYLKLFIEIRMQEVQMPEDLQYLKNILPELENNKKRIDEIIMRETRGIFRKRLKQLIYYRVWKAIMTEEEPETLKKAGKHKKLNY